MALIKSKKLTLSSIALLTVTAVTTIEIDTHLKS